MEYQDSIREGDGNRVFDCLQYFIVLFKATGRRNYAIEMFVTLAQYEWLLPDRQALQRKYSHFVNTRGLPGSNITCDLYMEHLNRIVKNCVVHLRSNKTEESFKRIGKCIGPLDEILTAYDRENNISAHSNHHSVAPSINDRNLIIKELLESDIIYSLLEQDVSMHTFLISHVIS